MMLEDSDSLQCDLAETYQIYDMHSHPLRAIAVFSYGLGDDSRIKRKISGISYSMDTLLLAHLVDSVNLMLWAQSKPGTERPDSLMEKLIPNDCKKSKGFSSPVEFENALKELKGGV